MTDRPSLPGMSVPTLADILQLLRPRLSQALLSGDGMQDVLACARELPSAAAQTGFALEFRCESQDPVADLSLLTRRGCAVSNHFIARGEVEGADAAAVALSSLFRQTERDDTLHSRAVGGIALEFDIAHSPPRGASPGIFVSPPEFRGDPSTGYADPGRLVAALAAAGCPEHAGDRGAIESIFAALPPGASVSHGGLFPAREPAIIRLNVAGVEQAGISSFLGRLGWPGAPDPAIEVLSDFRDLTPWFRVALDIYDGSIVPRLGLEVCQQMPRYKLGGDTGIWRRFIDRLEERQWCRPDKAAGLRAWPGWEVVFDGTGAFTAYRAIHHFKFDIRDEKIAARAYLFTLFRPVPGGQRA